MIKVLVCGGRYYNNPRRVWKALDVFHRAFEIYEVIDGECTSNKKQNPDNHAHQWAAFNKIKSSRFPADWKKYGRAAGPIRNRLMLKENPYLVIGFPGGYGTKDMLDIAFAEGIKTVEISDFGSIAYEI